MNRKLLVQMLKDGLDYPPGKHRLWVSKCFEITVHPNQVVELDEYEGVAAEASGGSRSGRGQPRAKKEMFHVGRTIMRLRDGQVTEESGAGWAGSGR